MTTPLRTGPRRRLPIALGLLAASPAWAPELVAQDPVHLPYERFRLENGLDVVIHPAPLIPSVTVFTRYGVGSGDEEPGRTGLAHLLEHLMFNGTPHVGPNELADHLVAAGGGANAATTRDETIYANWAGSHALELAIYLDADRMAHLPDALTQDVLDREREVVKNEFRERFLEWPYGQASFVVERHLFEPDHPYHRPVSGSFEDLDRVTVEDLRAFFRRYYAPANATVVVVGDTDVETARGLVDQWYGAIPAGPRPERPTRTGGTIGGEVRVVLEDEVGTPRLYVAWAGPALYAPGDAAMDVMARLLAEGAGGRLQRRLVDELEVAQSVSAENESRALAGVFQLVVAAAPDRSLDEVLAAVDGVLDELKREPPSEAELAGMVNAQRAYLLAGVESTGGRAGSLSRYLAHTGRPDYLAEDLGRYGSLSPPDIAATAASVLDDRRVVLSVVPTGRPELAAAGSRPVQGEAGVVPAVAASVATSHPQAPDWSSVPGTGEPPVFVPPEVVTRRLSNGAAVHVVERPGLPLVQVNVVLGTGSASEPTELPGLAQLTADLMRRGAGGRTAAEISAELARLGGSLGTSATYHTIEAHLQAPAETFEPALEVLADVVLRPTFDAEMFGSFAERRAVSLEGSGGSNVEVANSLFRRAVFPGHAYGRFAVGTAEGVRAATLDDVRSFYRAAADPGRMDLVLVGAVDPDDIVPVLERLFGGSWQSEREAGGSVAGEAQPPASPAVSGLFLVDRPGSSQSVVRIARGAPSRTDPDFAAFQVMNLVLGGSSTSRLGKVLRERMGVAYEARSDYGAHARGGFLVAWANVETDATAAAVKEMLAQLAALPGSITTAEVEVARAHLLLSYPEPFMTVAGTARSVAEVLAAGIPAGELQSYGDRVAAVTAADVERVARKYLVPSDAAVVIAGDVARFEAELVELGLGPAVRLTPQEALAGGPLPRP